MPADVVIVADSGPLIGLALIQQLALLRSEARPRVIAVDPREPPPPCDLPPDDDDG